MLGINLVQKNRSYRTSSVSAYAIRTERADDPIREYDQEGIHSTESIIVKSTGAVHLEERLLPMCVH